MNSYDWNSPRELEIWFSPRFGIWSITKLRCVTRGWYNLLKITPIFHYTPSKFSLSKFPFCPTLLLENVWKFLYLSTINVNTFNGLDAKLVKANYYWKRKRVPRLNILVCLFVISYTEFKTRTTDRGFRFLVELESEHYSLDYFSTLLFLIIKHENCII